jgi:hypothetical protein
MVTPILLVLLCHPTEIGGTMGWCKLCLFASLSAVIALLSGCRSKPPAQQSTTGEPQQALPEPVVPAGYQKIAPAPMDTSAQMLGQTATIFRGVLKDVKFTYENCAGPRTNYVFSDSSSIAGEKVASEVNLRVLGGPTPRGTWVGVSELPKLALDSQYVVFLRNTDWTFSPIVGNLVFRVETIGGREVLVHPSGRAVTGWGEDGPLLSAAVVSEAVGSRLHGYRGTEAPASAESRASAETDPKGEVRPANAIAPPQTADQGRVPDAPIARAPSAAEIRRAGMFARPALLASAISNEPTVSVNSFMGSIREAADKANVRIGGRVALDPNWRCWSSTPTMKVAR